MSDDRQQAYPTCPKCSGPCVGDHESYWCHACHMLWPLAPNAKARAGSYTWHAFIQGGIGPDVWDTVVTSTAADFMDAARQAQGKADYRGGYVTTLDIYPADQPALFCSKCAELERERNEARLRVERLEGVLRDEEATWETEVAAEQLSGNVVKEAYAKGYLAAVRMAKAVLDGGKEGE